MAPPPSETRWVRVNEIPARWEPSSLRALWLWTFPLLPSTATSGNSSHFQWPSEEVDSWSTHRACQVRSLVNSRAATWLSGYERPQVTVWTYISVCVWMMCRNSGKINNHLLHRVTHLRVSQSSLPRQSCWLTATCWIMPCVTVLAGLEHWSCWKPKTVSPWNEKGGKNTKALLAKESPLFKCIFVNVITVEDPPCDDKHSHVQEVCENMNILESLCKHQLACRNKLYEW